MKKHVFLLFAVFITAAFFEAAAKDDENSLKIDIEKTLKTDDKKTPEFNPEDTFKTDDKKSLEFNIDDTFKRTKNESRNPEKEIKEFLKKDKEKAKALYAQAKAVTQLLKEAKKFKDIRTAKLCGKIASGLKILAQFHEGKEISNRKLYKAYNDCKSFAKDIKQIKMRVAAAKRNTPQAIKIRKFQRSARSYFRKAEKAGRKGRKAEAEYYKTCALIKQKAAASYAENPGIEAASKKQLREARTKYKQESTKESAVLFRKRAAEQRKQDNIAKAQYYEKVANLKDKLAEAYAENNLKLAKTIQKEYRKLQADAL